MIHLKYAKFKFNLLALKFVVDVRAPFTSFYFTLVFGAFYLTEVIIHCHLITLM